MSFRRPVILTLEENARCLFKIQNFTGCLIRMGVRVCEIFLHQKICMLPDNHKQGV